jgi:hypothetical protein
VLVVDRSESRGAARPYCSTTSGVYEMQMPVMARAIARLGRRPGLTFGAQCSTGWRLSLDGRFDGSAGEDRFVLERCVHATGDASAGAAVSLDEPGNLSTGLGFVVS